jgi:hypothetical protein
MVFLHGYDNYFVPGCCPSGLYGQLCAPRSDISLDHNLCLARYLKPETAANHLGPSENLPDLGSPQFSHRDSDLRHN